MNRITQIILYVIVGLVSFVFFVILLFPLDAIISHKLADLEKQMKGRGDYRITVSSIDASLIFDTVFANFRLFKGKEEIFFAPRIEAGLSLLPLITGTVNVRFLADYKSGSISGRVTLAEESVVDVDIEDVTLRELDFLTRYMENAEYPVSLTGKIDGSVYLSWPADLGNREAEINIKIYRSKIKLGFFKKMEMEVPSLVLAQKKKFIELDGNLGKGRITLNRFSIPGPDVVLNLSGNARLNRNNDIVRSNFDGKLIFSEDVLKDLPFGPLLKEFQAPDGSYPLSIKGSLKKPQIKIGEQDLSQFLKF